MADAQRGGEVLLLGHAVDQAAGLGVGQQEVGEALDAGGIAQQRMVDRMKRAVGAAVAGIVEQLALLRRVGVGDDVAVLQIVGGRAVRQKVGQRRVLAELAADVGQVVGGIPGIDLALGVGRQLLLLELFVGRPEVAHGVDNHLGAGQQPQVVAGVAEVALDLPRLGLSRRRKLVVDRLFQRIAGVDVAQHAGDQDGAGTEQCQHREKLCRQAPGNGASGIGGVGRHAATIYRNVME